MAAKPVYAAGLDLGSRTTRLTVMEETPARSATADRVGVVCGSESRDGMAGLSK